MIFSLTFLFVFWAFLFAYVHNKNSERQRKIKQKRRNKKRVTPKSPIATQSREEKEKPVYLPEFQDKTLSEKKGATGEQIIKVLVLNHLNPEKYHYFNNLIIPTRLGKTTEIDGILVSPYGIFVVETKYHQGWIYGKADEVRWRQTLSRHAPKYWLDNPLLQNQYHIDALRHIVRQPANRLHSVVVFTHRQCQLKTELPSNVCLAKDFIDYIQSFQEVIIDDVQVARICATLSHADWQTTVERKHQHVSSLQKHIIH